MKWYNPFRPSYRLNAQMKARNSSTSECLILGKNSNVITHDQESVLGKRLLYWSFETLRPCSDLHSWDHGKKHTTERHISLCWDISLLDEASQFNTSQRSLSSKGVSGTWPWIHLAIFVRFWGMHASTGRSSLNTTQSQEKMFVFKKRRVTLWWYRVIKHDNAKSPTNDNKWRFQAGKIIHA